MTIFPAGPLAESAERLFEIVAESPTFQTKGGFANPTEAKVEIHFADVEGQRESVVYAVITPGMQLSFNQISGGTQNFLYPQGDLGLLMYMVTDPDLYEDDVQREWEAANFFGGVLQDVADKAGLDLGDGKGDLAIPGIDLLSYGETKHEDHEDLGRYWIAAASIRFGLE